MDREKLMENYKKKLDEMKEHKFIFWLVVFYPIAIYRSFKHKILPKWANITLTIFLTLTLILISSCVIYTALNPMDGVNMKFEESIEEYDLGEIRDIEYLGPVEDNLGIYELITTKSYYNVYISLNDEEIVVEGIKDLLKKENLYLSENIPFYYNKLDSSTIKFFIEKEKYREGIKEIVNGENYDIIKYEDNSEYKFVYEYYRVSDVYKIKEDDEELIYHRDNLITFKKDFQKIIDKRMDKFKEIKEIESFVVNETEISYTFTNFCDNSYKIIKNLDGSYTLQGADSNVSDSRVEQLWKQYKKEEGDK